MKGSRRIDTAWVSFDKPKNRIASPLFEMTDTVKSTMICVFVIFMVFFRAVSVSGDSMVPTLNDKNWVMITAITPGVKRGDIVVITQPWVRNNAIIKRVIGVEGDVVDIDFNKGEVYVNGELLDEPYIAEPTHLDYDVRFPVTVPPHKVFVMGDNRNESLDSRSGSVGFIDENYILGKGIYRIVPKFKSIRYKPQS